MKTQEKQFETFWFALIEIAQWLAQQRDSWEIENSILNFQLLVT